MTNRHLSSSGGSASDAHKFSPEEQAVLESSGSALLRKVLATVWRVKLRLQFTGWLQYIPIAILSLLFFLIATLVSFLGSAPAAFGFTLAGTLMLAVLLFDLITVKFRLRLPESLPKRNDDLGLFDLMRVRRSCRSFQTRKLTCAEYDELMESVRMHSAEHKIGHAPIRFEYVSAPLTVWPTVNASEFLVAIAPAEYNRLAVIDVGRSLQKIVMDATRMGLGTCWIGPGADQSSIVEQLGSRYHPQQDHIICVCAVGYKSRYIPLFVRIFNLQFHRRLPLSALFFADTDFKEPLDVEAYPFNQFGRCYEICQWAPSSYNGQTTRCVAAVKKPAEEKDDSRAEIPQLARFDFYALTESRYYAAVAVGIWCANWEMGCAALAIQGHLAVLPPAEREVRAETIDPQRSRYDVSWVLDEHPEKRLGK